MFQLDLSGKVAIVMGVANKRSLAFGAAEILNRAGARLAFTYVGERFGENVRELTQDFPNARYYECDVQQDESIDATFEAIARDFGGADMLVHSIAYAPREALSEDFLQTSREAYRIAMDVSAFSLIRVARAAAPLMEGRQGALVTMTYLGAEKVVPRYNVMGSAKAALEHAVRQLAFELGPRGIRVNAVSAGPVNTLSARGVRDLTEMLKFHAEKAPLKRNVSLEDIGRATLFLLTELSSGVTGETLHVDAGYSIMAM
jgi:enoyl-[acyl-carrier protein] reductase I